jgi:hypothetical protein
MMSRRSYPLLAAIGALALATAPCPAQYPPPGSLPAPAQQPTVSPYLNLTRRGASPGLNYYNLVRPQTQLFNSVQQLQTQVGVNRQDITGVQQSLNSPILPPTGHAAGFLTYRQYFMTNGAAGTAAQSGGFAAPGLSRGAATAPTPPRGR